MAYPIGYVQNFARRERGIYRRRHSRTVRFVNAAHHTIFVLGVARKRGYSVRNECGNEFSRFHFKARDASGDGIDEMIQFQLRFFELGDVVKDAL